MRRAEAKGHVLDALEEVTNQELKGLVGSDTELAELQIDEDDLEEAAEKISDKLGLDVIFEGQTTIGGLVDVVAEADEV